MISLIIPLPPSVNGLYANAPGRGRYITRVYGTWLTAAGLMVNRQKPTPVTGPYAVEIQLPRSMRGDCDNRIKPVLDLLVKLHVTPDDKHCHRVTASRVPGISEARVIVTEVVT